VLAVSPGLRVFVPKVGPDIKQLDGLGRAVHTPLDIRPRHPGGQLGAQGDTAAGLVVEGVHFFLYDVGGVAHPAQKQIRMLKYGCAYFRIAENIRNGADLVLDAPPNTHFFAIYVLGAFRCLRQHD
jgi:hypothetical protein